MMTELSENIFFVSFLLLAIISASVSDVPPVVNPGITLTPTSTLGECQACKLFVESFKRGLERTSRGKYEGGDTAWEEEKLKTSYKRSEMRLIDIQDSICNDEEKYSVQCHFIAEKAEEFIEEWWSQDPDESTDLHTYICVDKMKLCCPKHHYGKDCLPCPGKMENVCNGNGKCRGDGTRKGNGTCVCDAGYIGDICDQCMVGYYLSYHDEKYMLCSPCHRSCMGGCRNGSQKDCAACKVGFMFDSDKGCIDVNECDIENKCKLNEFCINSVGSYTCMACDKSCSTCYSNGPDMCRACAKGYSMIGDFCIVDSEVEGREENLTRSRYMTYIGLLIATGIILPASSTLGALTGALVLSFILGAEYFCMINGHKGLLDLKDFDLSQLLRT